MVLTNTNNSTTPCPKCGEPMPLVTWLGEKPFCDSCSVYNKTNISAADNGFFEEFDNEETCLHDELEKSLAPIKKGGAHNLVCNCPRCRITY